MKTVMAIDPGGTSGVAVRFVNGKILTCTTTTPEQLYNMMCNACLDHVVYESFQAQQINKYGLYTVELCGGIKAVAHTLGIPCAKHMPQDRYPFLDEAVKFLNDRKEATSMHYVVHEKDALAHLFRWEHDNEIKVESNG